MVKLINNIREISVTTIKDGNVYGAELVEFSRLANVFSDAEINNVKRLLFVYLDGCSLNISLPLTDKDKSSCIQSIKSEFDYADSRLKQQTQ